ncbi:MAG TPA: hypothetical protein PLH42_07390 [bacterium]|nr:hypothetical protein [bacterium]
MRYAVVVSVILCIALLSWWLWMSSPEREEEEVVSGPKIVIEKGEIIGMYEGRRSFILKADDFKTKTETVATVDGKIEGTVFDENGEIIASFEGLGGEVDLRNSNFKIYSGGRIKGEGFEVVANTITWNNSSNMFEANGDVNVHLNSYMVKCRDMKADFAAQVIELSGSPVLEF